MRDKAGRRGTGAPTGGMIGPIRPISLMGLMTNRLMTNRANRLMSGGLPAEAGYEVAAEEYPSRGCHSRKKYEAYEYEHLGGL